MTNKEYYESLYEVITPDEHKIIGIAALPEDWNEARDWAEDHRMDDCQEVVEMMRDGIANALAIIALYEKIPDDCDVGVGGCLPDFPHRESAKADLQQRAAAIAKAVAIVEFVAGAT